MKKPILATLLVVCLSNLTACGSDAHANNDDEPDSCYGYGSPGINVFVKDSLFDETLIENATVSLQFTDGETLVSDEAYYIESDDNLANTMTGAYYSLLSINVLVFEISVVVTAEGYDSFVTKNIGFETITSCGADNNLVLDVYLCPTGTSCI